MDSVRLLKILYPIGYDIYRDYMNLKLGEKYGGFSRIFFNFAGPNP